MHLTSVALIITLISTLALTQQNPTQTAAKPDRRPAATVSIDPYRAAAAKIMGAALVNDSAYRRLAYLTDNIGHRLSGSKSLERAIEWAIAEMQKDGLEDVRAEKVMVPNWVRGEESLEMLSPLPRKLPMLGLGNSIGTAEDGITAETLVVRNFDELDVLGERARGKIVVYNVPFTTYGATVRYRGAGASRAARYGAVAALVRSVTPVSLQTPHTGGMSYDEKQPKIPAAAITIETAEWLQRLQDSGERARLRLKMEAKFLPDAESANVIGELRGSEKPDEIVLVSGHLDSWDVGQGAHDDGGGCIVVWEAVRLLKELGLRPRRTIRVVLFTNEENGLRGATSYRDTHRNELPKHIFAMEADSGTYRPLGFGLGKAAPDQGRSNLEEIAKLLAGIDADRIGPDGGGADIGPIMREGVIGAGLTVDGTHYFDIHHTEADTLEKIDPRDLALCVATVAVVAYTIADMPQRLDQ